MLNLRLFRDDDSLKIKQWPAYADGFAEMDYALRENGWIDEYYAKPGTWIYIAESQGETVGFSLLSKTQDNEAEFRIAIHPQWLGKGIGKAMTIQTLKLGFQDKGLERIILIVRKTNHAAERLYQKIGFVVNGSSQHVIQGNLIEFTDMSMSKKVFEALVLD